jgi:hypothetical protein
VNSGQTIIAIAALMLLSKLILSGNEMMASGGDVVLVGQAMIEATTIAQSRIESISLRNFDNAVPPHGTPTASSFASIGLDAGENAALETTLNDVDDFNGHCDTVISPSFGSYIVNSKVYFIRTSAPYDSVGTKTYMKRIDVTVNNAFLVDPSGNDPLKLKKPLLLYQILSYH